MELMELVGPQPRFSAVPSRMSTGSIPGVARFHSECRSDRTVQKGHLMELMELMEFVGPRPRFSAVPFRVSPGFIPGLVRFHSGSRPVWFGESFLAVRWHVGLRASSGLGGGRSSKCLTVQGSIGGSLNNRQPPMKLAPVCEAPVDASPMGRLRQLLAVRPREAIQDRGDTPARPNNRS